MFDPFILLQPTAGCYLKQTTVSILYCFSCQNQGRRGHCFENYTDTQSLKSTLGTFIEFWLFGSQVFLVSKNLESFYQFNY